MDYSQLALRNRHARMGYEAGGEWCTGCSWRGADWSTHRDELKAEYLRRQNPEQHARMDDATREGHHA